MLRRELIRIGFCTVIGILAGIFLALEHSGFSTYAIICPFYAIGIFYAGSILIRILHKTFQGFFRYQMMSFYFRSIIGTVISIILLFGGVAFVFGVGWIIGIGRCIYSVVMAVQMDRSLC